MSHLRNKRIAITGSKGFLGKSLTKELDNNGIKYSEVLNHCCDLTQFDQVDNFFKDLKPDLVFHLAADCGGIGYNVKNPADITHNNLMMSTNLFRSAVKHGNPKLIMIGSVDSYPSEAKIPYSENEIWMGFPEVTSGYYGLAKRMNLALGNAYFNQYGLHSIHPILMNLYGPNDHFDSEKGHVIPAMIKKIDQAIKDDLTEIEIFGNGSVFREFIYVEDAAKLIIKASSLNNFEYFNLGSGDLIKIIDVISIIKNKFGYSGLFNHNMSKPIGHKIKQFDLRKMEKLLGQFDFTPFSEGITKTINWYNENLKK